MSSMVSAELTSEIGSAAGDVQRPRPQGISAFVRKSPLGALCLLVIVFAVLFAALGPVLGTGDPEQIDTVQPSAAPHFRSVRRIESPDVTSLWAEDKAVG